MSLNTEYNNIYQPHRVEAERENMLFVIFSVLFAIVMYATAVAYCIVIYILFKYRNDKQKKLNSSFMNLCIVIGCEDILVLISNIFYSRLFVWFDPDFSKWLLRVNIDEVRLYICDVVMINIVYKLY